MAAAAGRPGRGPRRSAGTATRPPGARTAAPGPLRRRDPRRRPCRRPACPGRRPSGRPGGRRTRRPPGRECRPECREGRPAAPLRRGCGPPRAEYARAAAASSLRAFRARRAQSAIRAPTLRRWRAAGAAHPVGTPHARGGGVNIVVLGLTVSSSWGNGHATLWRALGRALSVRGHRLVFFERDVPYYAAHRDGTEFPGIDLRLYREWADLRGPLSAHLASADVVMLTSFCPDGGALARVICEAPRPLRVFYDLDTPVTLAKLDAGEAVDYLPADGLGAFDLVLSYTGGRALDALRTRLGARRTAPLYGSVEKRRGAPRPQPG